MTDSIFALRQVFFITKVQNWDQIYMYKFRRKVHFPPIISPPSYRVPGFMKLTELSLHLDDTCYMQVLLSTKHASRNLPQVFKTLGHVFMWRRQAVVCQCLLRHCDSDGRKPVVWFKLPGIDMRSWLILVQAFYHALNWTCSRTHVLSFVL